MFHWHDARVCLTNLLLHKPKLHSPSDGWLLLMHWLGMMWNIVKVSENRLKAYLCEVQRWHFMESFNLYIGSARRKRIQLGNMIMILTISPKQTIQRRIHFWVLEFYCCLKFCGEKRTYINTKNQMHIKILLLKEMSKMHQYNGFNTVLHQQLCVI